MFKPGDRVRRLRSHPEGLIQPGEIVTVVSLNPTFNTLELKGHSKGVFSARRFELVEDSFESCDLNKAMAENRSGFIIVNVSRGPAIVPRVHPTFDGAKTEAKRLLKGQPSDKFFVVAVEPKYSVQRRVVEDDLS